MSGEHLVTKCLFRDSVSIRGFSWCPDDYVTVGINSLTANILCRAHNSRLSDLDAAAYDMWCVLRRVSDLISLREREVAAGIRKRRSKVRFLIDGARLERWAFKTTINMMASGNVRGLQRGWQPSASLARYVFGDGALPDGCGMGVAIKMGERLHDEDHISFALVRRLDLPSRPEIDGFQIGFRGLRLIGFAQRPMLSFQKPVEFDYSGPSVLLRPKTVGFTGIAELNFDWSGAHRNDLDKNVVRVRRVFANAK